MSTKREMKDQVYENIAAVGKAIASPKRLEILALLTQGEKSVEALAEHTELDFKLISAHLKVLKTSRLVTSRRDGKRIIYRMADPAVASFWVGLKSLAELRFSEIQETVDTYFSDRASMTTLDRSTLLRRARTGDIIVIDVRPNDEYLAGHIPGALSIPIEELERRLSGLPKDRAVVAYCRGPYCVFAYEAVKVLRENGYRAQCLADGVSEWGASGLPIARGQGFSIGDASIG